LAGGDERRAQVAAANIFIKRAADVVFDLLFEIVVQIVCPPPVAEKTDPAKAGSVDIKLLSVST
jgi:hypothetical protein